MYNVSLKMKSFDLENLIQCEKYLLSIFNFLNLDQVKHQVQPRTAKKITVCRSPHLDKKSREQFQILTYKKKLICSFSSKLVFLFFLDLLKDITCIGIELELLIDYPHF